MTHIPLALRAALLGLAALTSTSSAQDSSTVDQIPFAPLVRPSRLAIGWPAGTMYEGAVGIPVHMYSRTDAIMHLGDATGTSRQPPCVGKLERWMFRQLAGDSTPAMGCVLTFTPRFVVRQQRGGSAEVRAPNFNPEVEFALFSLDTNVAEDSFARHLRTFDGGTHAVLSASQIRVGHYSNGAAGCLYTHQSRPVDDPVEGECAPRASGSDTLETLAGSFSTHYLEGEITIGYAAFDRIGSERGMLSIGLGVRAHPGGWVSSIGGMSTDQAQTYGRWEFSGRAQLRGRNDILPLRYLPLLRPGFRTTSALMVETVYAPRRPHPHERWRGSAEALLAFPHLYGFGVSARYVWGWDYYNVAYGSGMRNPWRGTPTISISFDHSRAMAITKEARRLEAR